MTSLLQANELFVAPSDRNEFENLQSAIAAEFAPTTEFQRQCAKTILHALWSIRRTRILEAHLQELAFTAHGIEGLFTVESSKQFKDLLAARRQAERSYEKAVKEVRAQQQQPPAAPAPQQAKPPRLKIVHSNTPEPTAAPVDPNPSLPGKNPQFVDPQWLDLPLAG